MKYLPFSKLKAFRKAKDLSKKVNELSKSLPRNGPDDLCSRIKNNSFQTVKSIKLVWVEGRKKQDFIRQMEEVILYNSELELLLHEAKANGFIDADIYEEYLEECLELRDLQLKMFNNAAVYFDKGRAPESWFEM